MALIRGRGAPLEKRRTIDAEAAAVVVVVFV
jgi:hypothetical protein